jgi:hypothetical protein
VRRGGAVGTRWELGSAGSSVTTAVFIAYRFSHTNTKHHSVHCCSTFDSHELQQQSHREFCGRASNLLPTFQRLSDAPSPPSVTVTSRSLYSVSMFIPFAWLCCKVHVVNVQNDRLVVPGAVVINKRAGDVVLVAAQGLASQSAITLYHQEAGSVRCVMRERERG